MEDKLSQKPAGTTTCFSIFMGTDLSLRPYEDIVCGPYV